MKKKTRRTAKISLALFVLMGGWWGPSVVMTNQVAHAAVQNQNEITQDEAVNIAKSLLTIPSDAKKEQVRYEPAHPEWGQRYATWNLSWRTPSDEGISATLEARTGKLLNYYVWKKEDALKTSTKEVTPEAAEKVAEAFLQKAAKDTVGQLSKANEYKGNNFLSRNEIGRVGLRYTRVENGIPFLENGIDVVIDSNLQVTSFNRTWSNEPLPDAKATLSLEEAQKKLEEGINPSLQYTKLSNMYAGVGSGSNPFQLVYQYGSADPSMVHALSGELLTSTGQIVSKEKPVEPLGNTVRSDNETGKLITESEAQKIAEEWIKRFPGTFLSEGSHGGGSSSDEDGNETRHWSFAFTPANSTKTTREEGISLDISDRGELVGYENRTKQSIRYGGRAEKIDSPVPWTQAKEKAIQFVKNVYPDRLGELYLISKEPSAERLQSILENNRQNYEIRFGWLVDGVPVETVPLGIEIDPKDGEIIAMNNNRYENAAKVEKMTPKVDVKQAVEEELKQKKVTLTYFEPGFNYRFGEEMGVPTKPTLVYRLVGSNGVVDAVTGKWIDFEEVNQKNVPQDIEKHPNKEALTYAVSHNILQVQDGKLEPDKLVTKGEFLSALLKIGRRYEFHTRFNQVFHDNEPVVVRYKDISEKNPYYGVIQQAVKYELLPNVSENLKPDEPVTRIEAAEFVIRFLGLDPVTKREEIFTVPFTDVSPADTPAVAIAYSLGLFSVKENQKEFKPKQAVTKADIAVMYKQLMETFGQNR